MDKKMIQKVYLFLFQMMKKGD